MLCTEVTTNECTCLITAARSEPLTQQLKQDFDVTSEPLKHQSEETIKYKDHVDRELA